MNILAQAASSGDLIIKNDAGNMTIKSPLRPEITNISGLFNTLLKFFLPFAIVIFFVMSMYAGYLLLSSEGSAEKIKKAQSIFISSIIGFILLITAFFVVRVVASIFGFTGGILPQ